MDGIIHVEWYVSTDGTGYWTNQRKLIKIKHLLAKNSELRVVFDINTWDTGRDGLIYTDPLFELMLKMYIGHDFGFDVKDVDICYSEQGMQCSNFVSFDASETFIDKLFHSQKRGDNAQKDL